MIYINGTYVNVKRYHTILGEALPDWVASTWYGYLRPFPRCMKA